MPSSQKEITAKEAFSVLGAFAGFVIAIVGAAIAKSALLMWLGAGMIFISGIALFCVTPRKERIEGLSALAVGSVIFGLIAWLFMQNPGVFIAVVFVAFFAYLIGKILWLLFTPVRPFNFEE